MKKTVLPDKLPSLYPKENLEYLPLFLTHPDPQIIFAQSLRLKYLVSFSLHVWYF